MLDVTETKGINYDLCAHSVQGCEVGTDVACIKDIKIKLQYMLLEFSRLLIEHHNMFDQKKDCFRSVEMNA